MKKYLFSKIFEYTENICLEESDRTIRNEEKVGHISCSFFQNKAANMGITKTFSATERPKSWYQNHPIIAPVNKHMINSELTLKFQSFRK